MLPGLKFLLVLLGIHNGVDKEQSQTGEVAISPKLQDVSSPPLSDSGPFRTACSKYISSVVHSHWSRTLEAVL